MSFLLFCTDQDTTLFPDLSFRDRVDKSATNDPLGAPRSTSDKLSNIRETGKEFDFRRHSHQNCDLTGPKKNQGSPFTKCTTQCRRWCRVGGLTVALQRLYWIALRQPFYTINNATPKQRTTTPNKLEKNYGKSASKSLKSIAASGIQPSAVVLGYCLIPPSGSQIMSWGHLSPWCTR